MPSALRSRFYARRLKALCFDLCEEIREGDRTVAGLVQSVHFGFRASWNHTVIASIDQTVLGSTSPETALMPELLPTMLLFLTASNLRSLLTWTLAVAVVQYATYIVVSQDVGDRSFPLLGSSVGLLPFRSIPLIDELAISYPASNTLIPKILLLQDR